MREIGKRDVNTKKERGNNSPFAATMFDNRTSFSLLVLFCVSPWKQKN